MINFRSLALAVVCAALGVLALAAAPAFASTGYQVRGYLAPASRAEFIAVDDSENMLASGYKGDIYVLAGGAVKAFTAAGKEEFQFALNELPPGPGGNPHEVEGHLAVDNSESAVDPSAGDIYLDTALELRYQNKEVFYVSKFTAAGKYVSEIAEREQCAPSGGVEECKGKGTKIPLGHPGAVTVDSEGDVWITESSHSGTCSGGCVDEFSDEGSFIKSLAVPGVGGPSLAVDSKGDVYVEGVKYGPEGTKLAVYGSGGPLAIDSATNNLFVDVGSAIDEYGPFGVPYEKPIEMLPPGGFGTESTGVAVNALTDTIYASEFHENRVVVLQFEELPDVTTGSASEQTETEATVSGTVNPTGIGVTSCEFEYATEAEYTDTKTYGQQALCESPAAAEIGAGEEAVPVHARLKNLEPNAVYHYRLKAGDTLAGHERYATTAGSDVTFGAPVVTTQPLTEVGATGATVHAQLNPEQSGVTYEVEYGTSASYGSTTPPLSIGGGTVTQVAVALAGLTPDTSYHYRVVASNASGTSRAPDGTFETYSVGPPATLGLPDGRVYELVSPLERDAEVYVPFGSPAESMPSALAQFQAAADGGAVAYPGSPSGPGGNGNVGAGSNGNEYVARRGSAGWEAQDVQPPGSATAFYEGFTSDLSTGFLAAIGAPPLSGEASEVDAGLPASTTRGYPIIYEHPFGSENYTPLFTTKPPHTNPVGAVADEFRSHGFEEFGLALAGHEEGIDFVGATQDLSHVLFAANDALKGARPRATFGNEKENNLYDLGEGQLRTVNVLPDGKSEPGAAFGAAVGPDLSQVMSSDGSKIYWTDQHAGSNEGRIFVRENDGQPKSKLGEHGECLEVENACTVAVSAGAAQFWTATADGRFAFYVEAGGLYRFNLESQAREPLVPAAAEVQGVIGVSETGEEEGEYIYFVATGEALAPGAKEGAPNLYLRHNATTTLIATLNPADDSSEGFAQNGGQEGSVTAGDWAAVLGWRTAEVSPDGRSVVFMSLARLPTVNFPGGYDNIAPRYEVRASDGELKVHAAGPVNEVYVYQAGGGGLFCASCNPTGAPPSVAGLGSWLQYTISNTYQMRWLSNNGGRVFFDSLEPLVPQDINGAGDVYEWERDGEGSCAHSKGCVYLLSGGGGSSGNGSFLMDASESGDDVFIATRARLLAQDKGESVVLYDASTDPLPVLAPSQCTGTGCQGVPGSPPVFATPSSETFNGVGNFTGTPASTVTVKSKRPTRGQKLTNALRACKKDRSKRKRVRCEARARKLFIAKSSAKRGR